MIKRIYLRKDKRDPHQNAFGWGYKVVIEPYDWRNSWPTEKELEKKVEPFIHSLDEFQVKFAPGTYYPFYICYEELRNEILFSVVKNKNTAEAIRKWFVDHFRPETQITILQGEVKFLQDKISRRNRQIRDLRKSKSLTTKK